MGNTIRARVAVALTAVAAAGAVIGGQPADAKAVATPGHVQTSIKWGACPEPAPGAKRDPRQTCGTVKVPLDYRRPGGETITVAVSRIATAKPGKKRGDLLFNPGGPGLPGLDMPGQMAATLPKEVLDSYDLIGFDARGIGHSTPMSCGLTGPALLTIFPYPGAGGSIEGNVATARTAARECATIGARLRFFTSANTARDMDRIRQALGARKISYWGQSFGTYLGAVYASLFPRNTGRMVLEGNVDPDKVWAKMLNTWNQGMNDRFPDAARVAAADDAGLGLGGTVEKVTDTFLALADRLDRKPATVPGTQVAISGALLRGVTYQMLLHNETLAPLTRFWKAASDLSAGRTPADADAAVLRQVLADTPAAKGVPADNQATMALAMICGDTTWSRDVDSYAKATAAARARYPLSAGMPDNITACAFWSQKPIEPVVEITSHGPRDILILQNRRDNATPWAAGRGMREALGERAGFLGVDNGGHYVYNTGSACADQATVAFLSKATPPAKEASCDGPRPS
ncbi:transporter [[Actinomadura] parvosata subsp. kistnae]|uniref:Transporter n=1 Tax=[Actinomadura] parvosata subsp. kistnae TaxID=1909395 RepID=A0A1U9ZQU2_9ACTN|nr:alpha/beta hydrolase [Nonomuraea sp. ATCC 55076]AQZ60315.1 transporter [Nonomuraea sp. ATCC 55076]